MKIFQIIAEDYDNLAVLAPSSGSSPAQGTDKKATAPAEPTLATKLGYTAAGLTALPLAGWTVRSAAKFTAQELSNASRTYARKLKIYDVVEAGWQKKFGGPATTLFKILGLTSALTNLYSNLVVLEAMYVQGKLPGDDGGRARYEEQREFEFGVFETQILVPAIARTLLRISRSVTAAKLLLRLLGGFASFATAGVSLAVTLATEAGLAWLQHWLGTDAGRQWLWDYCAPAVRGIGKPMDALVSGITNAYQKADVKKYGSEEGAKKAQADREQKAATKTANVKTVTTKSGDVVVTDEQGYLLPSLTLRFDQALQQARKDAIKAGQPDPLKQFPVKPGEKFPALN